MTYSQFLNNLVSPIAYFITWLGSTLDYLITNYFFITILGISLISSLLFYFLSHLLFNLNNSSKDLDHLNYKNN